MKTILLFCIAAFFFSSCVGSEHKESRPIADPNSECHAVKLHPTDPQAYNPDPKCTPGVINPEVTQQNLQATICKSGYSKSIRPPTSYTTPLKIKQIEEYGYFDKDLKNYEEDHFISLQLGGHPSDPRNLWPEPHPSMNKKDYVENYLHDELCEGRITLAQAHYLITQEWYKVYRQQYPPSLFERMSEWLRN